MKTSVKLLALAALTMSAMAIQAQDAISFKRVYTNGAVEKYTVSSQMTSVTDLSSMGQGEQSMDIDTSMDAQFTYSAVKEDGSALLSFLYNNIKIKAEGPMAEMMGQMGDQAPKEIKGTQKVDVFGRATETKLEGASANMMSMMSGGANAWDAFAFFILPDKPVKIGDTWDFEIPTMGGMFAKGSKLNGKFVGEGTLGEKKTWTLEFTGKPKMSMDIGKMMADNPNAQNSGMPPMNILMEGENAMKIKISVDQTTFQILSAETASETVAKVKLVDMGVEFPSTTQMVSKISLKK